MKKSKTCGQCCHCKNGFCAVTDLSANTYDDNLGCIFYNIRPLALARKTFQAMKRKYDKRYSTAVNINDENMKGEN